MSEHHLLSSAHLGLPGLYLGLDFVSDLFEEVGVISKGSHYLFLHVFRQVLELLLQHHLHEKISKHFEIIP